MVVNEHVLNHVKYLFEQIFRRPGLMLERNLKQAEVPDVCTVLHNSRGTAPGMWFSPGPPAPQRGDPEPDSTVKRDDYQTAEPIVLAEGKTVQSTTQIPPLGGGGAGGAVFISLPGVPHEMKGLMIDEVIPRILKHFELPVIIHRTAFTSGAGESMIDEHIKEFEAALPKYIKLAYLRDLEW
jgi:nicotinamide-nucleotide amidase